MYAAAAMLEKFNSHINKHGPKVRKYVLKLYPELKGSRCWVWMYGERPKDSYGRMFLYGENRLVLAHRFAYELFLNKKLRYLNLMLS
jgi:hypothetical protein